MSWFFWLQKTLLMLLLPPSSPLLLTAFGLWQWRCRRRRLGGGLMAGGALLLLACSLPPLAGELIAPLERQHPPLAATPAAVDAVVVLTAGTLDLSQRGLGAVPDGSSLLRLHEGVRLWRRYQQQPLIICGGRGDPARPELSSGLALANAALTLGVPAERLLVEDASHNTLEGAQQVRRLLKTTSTGDPTVILVTSAYHMERAARFFRAAGFRVLAAPCDFRAQAGNLSPASLIPDALALYTSRDALYEYLVRLRYLLP